MKYIKKFEIKNSKNDDNNLIINDLFIIRRITSYNKDDKYVYNNNGKKKLVGKIEFKFRINKYENFSTYTPITGVVKILDTKYENDERIKNFKITLKPSITISTKRAIFKSFLKELGYSDKEFELILGLCLKNMPNEKFENMIESQTIGELIIRVKEFKNYFNKYQANIYDAWLTEKDVYKYNL